MRQKTAGVPAGTVEASVKVINPTPMVQSMLYWANVSVHCNEQYRVIFPPDVQAGTDHSKVYFTHWPMGSLTHGADKSVDVSWWKNFTLNSRSIFAWDSKMGFLAGYDYGKDAGTVHVANRFQVPGKKFFLWGNNKSGHMWNKILSDKDGHYLELMVGAYSDNQPDYSWIAPGEIREFKQTWFPIKGIQGVKNATENAAVNFEPDHETGKWKLGFNTSSIYKNAKVLVTWKDRKLVEKTIDINPDKYFLERIDIPSEAPAEELNVALLDAEGNERQLVNVIKISVIENKVRYFWVKPSDVSIYVARGAADIGVCGKDILLEYEPDISELLDMKTGICRMAVAAPKGFKYDPSKTLRVATKFAKIAQKFYQSKGRDIDIIHLNGSIELAPLLGLSDVIVDIVETGTTLKENNLEEIAYIMDATARLICNRVSFKLKFDRIHQLTEDLRKILELAKEEQK